MNGALILLVVEDEADAREVLAELLREAGLLVHTAANGQEALDYLQRGPRPDAIVTDLMMPVMNGWDLLERLEADDELSSIPVIVTSAALHRDLPKSIPVLEKPLNFEGLLKTLHALRG